MAKKRKKVIQVHIKPISRILSEQQTRDYSGITRAALSRRGALDSYNSIIRRLNNAKENYLREVEDRRTLPKAFKEGRYLHINGTPARIRYLPLHNRVPWLQSRMRPRFLLPEKTVVCVRRENRRRSLFALQKIGRGRGGGQKRPRWTASSYIHCK